MKTDGTVILTWTFTPKDFFEEEVEFAASGANIKIRNGDIETAINCASYNDGLEDELHQLIEERFRAGMVSGHASYELSKPNKTIEYPDGRRDVYARVGTVRMAMVIGKADFRIVDKDGRTIADSKRERIDYRNNMGELVAKHRSDGCLKGMIDSYAAAVSDPDDELTHLYEIRDAAVKKFGGNKEARQVLGASDSNWSEFGDICNDRPLRQGRHRGKKREELRKATSEELESARRFAKSLIEGYVRYLETQSVG